jgi:tRNA (guanine37-N1)-methyltransferase
MTLELDVITLFPPMFAALTEHGISARAAARGRFRLQCWNPRDFTSDAHRTVDDRPYGGGPGMVMLPQPLEDAIAAAKARQVSVGAQPKVVLLSPQGIKLDHAQVMRMKTEAEGGTGLVLLCGRYEGIDERVIARHVDESVSVGDYVLSGGELPAMTLIDALVRQLPGVMNDDASVIEDSFVGGLLDCPHYTRPEVHDGVAVPEVLRSGNHKAIARWRLKQSLVRTAALRPDLFEAWRARSLDRDQAAVLSEVLLEINAQKSH